MSVNHEVDVKRTVTGLIMAAVVVGVLCVRGLPMLLLIMLVAALGLWEFFSLFWGKTRPYPHALLCYSSRLGHAPSDLDAQTPGRAGLPWRRFCSGGYQFSFPLARG